MNAPFRLRHLPIGRSTVILASQSFAVNEAFLGNQSFLYLFLGLFRFR